MVNSSPLKWVRIKYSLIASKHDSQERTTIGRCGVKGMNVEEYLFNKQLLQDISKKKQMYKQAILDPKF